MLDSEKIRDIEKVKRENTKEEINEPSKVKKAVSVIIVQLIIAFVLVVALFLLKTFKEDEFNQIKDYYNSSEYFLIKEEEGIIIIE